MPAANGAHVTSQYHPFFASLFPAVYAGEGESLSLLALSWANSLHVHVFVPPHASVLANLRSVSATKPVVFGYVKGARNITKLHLKLQNSHFTALNATQSVTIAQHAEVDKLMDPTWCVASGRCVILSAVRHVLTTK